MEGIAAYSSSDEDILSTSHPNVSPQIPLPSAARLLSPSTDGLPTGPAPHADAHQGRVRSFPHVQGNYATHVYMDITTPPTCKDPLETFLQAVRRHMPDLQPVIDLVPSVKEGICAKNAELVQPQYHLSLSRTAPVRFAQIELLTSALKRALKRLGCFHLVIGRDIEVFVNDDGTRTFLALSTHCEDITHPSAQVATGSDALARAIHCISDVLVLHGLPKYYEDPKPHISIAWVLGNQVKALEKALLHPTVVSAAAALRHCRWVAAPGSMVLRIGKRLTEVWQRHAV